MKYLWIIFGSISFIIGSVGIFLPVIPFTPFYLFSIFAFSKSSKKLHTIIVNSKMYKDHILPVIKEKKMAKMDKIKVLLLLSLLIAVGSYFLIKKRIFWPLIILGIVYIFHLIFFIFYIKNSS